MNSVSHHGLLAQGKLVTLAPDGTINAQVPPWPGSYIDACELALAHRLTSLWMLDSELAPSVSGGAYSILENERHKRIATASVWKRGTGKHPINLIFTRNTSWAELLGESLPEDLLVALGYVEQVTGMPVTGSPGSMGWDLLKSIHPEWIETIPVDLRELHFTARAGSDLIWQCPDILEQVLGHCYVHKFDKGGAYPYAGTVTDIGVGTPGHLAGEEACRASAHEKGHPQEVGVWYCTVRYGAYNPALPPALNEHRARGYEGWLAGPIIRLLRASGHAVDVREGYVFPARHDVMAKWGKFLWEARQALADTQRFPLLAPARLAQRMIKRISVATVGFTAYKGFPDDEEEKRRPDIRLQVVSRNRELVKHNIVKWHELYGVAPLMVYMDAVYYASNEQNPRAIWPEIVKREGLLGGYKLEWTIPVTPGILAMFAQKMGVAERLEVLNREVH